MPPDGTPLDRSPEDDAARRRDQLERLFEHAELTPGPLEHEGPLGSPSVLAVAAARLALEGEDLPALPERIASRSFLAYACRLVAAPDTAGSLVPPGEEARSRPRREAARLVLAVLAEDRALVERGFCRTSFNGRPLTREEQDVWDGTARQHLEDVAEHLELSREAGRLLRDLLQGNRTLAASLPDLWRVYDWCCGGCRGSAPVGPGGERRPDDVTPASSRSPGLGSPPGEEPQTHRATGRSAGAKERREVAAAWLDDFLAVRGNLEAWARQPELGVSWLFAQMPDKLRVGRDTLRRLLAGRPNTRTPPDPRLEMRLAMRNLLHDPGGMPRTPPRKVDDPKRVPTKTVPLEELHPRRS